MGHGWFKTFGHGPDMTGATLFNYCEKLSSVFRASAEISAIRCGLYFASEKCGIKSRVELL